MLKFLKMALGNEGGYWQMLAGAGLGLLKNKADKERADRMNQAAATQTMYSPHTGMGPGQITQAPSGFEAALQGGMAGAQMGMMGKSAGLWGQGSEAASGATSAAASGGGQMSAVPMQAQAISPDVANSYVANNQNRNQFGNDWFMGMGQQNPYTIPNNTNYVASR